MKKKERVVLPRLDNGFSVVKVQARGDGGLDVDLSFPSVASEAISPITRERNRAAGSVWNRMIKRTQQKHADEDGQHVTEASLLQRADRQRNFERLMGVIMKGVEEQLSMSDGMDRDKTEEDKEKDKEKRKKTGKRGGAGGNNNANDDGNNNNNNNNTGGNSNSGLTREELREKGRLGRYALLQEKLDEFRNDPMKLDMLKQRIAERKAERIALSHPLSSRDHIEANRSALVQFSPRERRARLHEAAENRERHFLDVLRASEQNQLEMMEHLKMATRRREFREERERQIREEHREKALIRVRAKKWMMLVAISSRQALWLKKLEYERVSNEIELRRRRAAYVIHRFYRQTKKRVFEREQRYALGVIRRFMKKVMLRRRRAAKIRAANLLVTFLNDVKNMEGIVTVIRQFRQNVVAAQRFWRAFSSCKQARIEVLLRQWDVVQLAKAKRAQKLRAINNQSIGFTSSVPPAGGKPGGSPRKNAPPPQMTNAQQLASSKLQKRETLLFSSERVPLHIKRKLLEENLRQRRAEFSNQLSQYIQQRKDWESEEAKRQKLIEARKLVSNTILDAEGLTSRPMKPMFRVTLPEKEMLRLIEQGIAMYAEERANNVIAQSDSQTNLAAH